MEAGVRPEAKPLEFFDELAAEDLAENSSGERSEDSGDAPSACDPGEPAGGARRNEHEDGAAASDSRYGGR